MPETSISEIDRITHDIPQVESELEKDKYNPRQTFQEHIAAESDRQSKKWDEALQIKGSYLVDQLNRANEITKKYISSTPALRLHDQKDGLRKLGVEIKTHEDVGAGQVYAVQLIVNDPKITLAEVVAHSQTIKRDVKDPEFLPNLR